MSENLKIETSSPNLHPRAQLSPKPRLETAAAGPGCLPVLEAPEQLSPKPRLETAAFGRLKIQIKRAAENEKFVSTNRDTNAAFGRRNF